MNKFICFFYVSWLLGSFSTYSLAQETYNAEDWTTIKLESLTRSKAPRKFHSFERNGVSYAFDATPVQGQWLRVSTNTAITAPDIYIGTSSTDHTKNAFSKAPPTQCTIEGEVKACVNRIWVTEKTDTIGFDFSWHKNKDLTLDNIKYELARNATIDPNNEIRFKALLSEITQKYYRSSEVDWQKAYSVGSKAEAVKNSV